MKAWFLAALLAVVVIGGVASAVSPGDGAAHDTPIVDVLDADALVAPTLDAALAYDETIPAILIRLLEAPVFPTLCVNTMPNVRLTGALQRAKHAGKLNRNRQAVNHVMLATTGERAHPLLC